MMPFESSVLFGGLKIVKSPMAVSKQRNKAHKLNPKRKNSYHLRIQKKWDKKFGFTMVPGMFMLKAEGILVVHPAAYENLMAALKAEQKKTAIVSVFANT
jgi:acetoin utilization deacetylase AcuC-like enzyme